MKIATVCCSKPGAMQTEPALAVCTTAAAKPTTRRLLHPKQTAALPTPTKPCTSQLEAVPLSTTQYCPHLRVVLQQLVGQHQRDHGLNHGHGARHHAGVVPPPRQQLNVLALQQGWDHGGRQVRLVRCVWCPNKGRADPEAWCACPMAGVAPDDCIAPAAIGPSSSILFQRWGWS